MVAGLGEASVATTKSQVAFRRRRGFAYAWRPGQYVTSDVPLVLSIALPHAVDSGRIKPSCTRPPTCGCTTSSSATPPRSTTRSSGG